MPVSARTVERRISEMASNVNEQQSVALNDAGVFSVVFDESVDINDIPRLAIIARYSNTEICEELCCLKPTYDIKAKDVVKTFIDHFEQRRVDIKKIFAVTTDGAPAMVVKHNGFVSLIEDRIGHPIMKFTVLFTEKIFVQKFRSRVSIK